MNPKEFYTETKAAFQKENEQLKKQVFQISMLRLLVFLGTAFGIYKTFQETATAGLIFLLGVVIFGFLMVKHSTLIRNRKIVRKKIDINTTELKLLDGTFYTKDHGSEFIDGSHEFSHDIDLFGEYSFFFYLNRTDTHKGRAALARILSSNEKEAVRSNQES